MTNSKIAAGLVSVILAASPAAGERQMERLERGLVAVAPNDGGVFVSWRLLKEDGDAGFHVYHRQEGEVRRMTDEPLMKATSLLLPEAEGDGEYFVRAVREGEEGEPSSPAAVLEKPYLEIPIRPIEGYRPGDCSVGDLTGDGNYELIVQQDFRPRDNSFTGITGTSVLDAYRLDGTFLWRIDLGINIREGEHYTQFMVYDLDGNGRAEIACKTADGTIDGTGKVIGDPDKDWRNREEGTRRYGRILEGPEYFTIFDGQTGAALETVDYIPGRDPINGWGGIGGNGGNDSYGNRGDRFLACVAYLDGERPSVVMARGVYGRTVLAAWDWRDGELTSRWVFDSGISYPPFDDASPYSGMGGHSLSVADVDDDGRDEIIYQAMTVDDDGEGLYSTERRHGDIMHVGNFNPQREGMELYLITENEDWTTALETPGAGMHDAATGELLWSHSPGVDFSDGMVADIDPRHPGAEVWGGPGGLRTVTGRQIGKAPRNSSWVIWWDGDLLREIYGNHRVFKWDWEAEREEQIFSVEDELGRRARHSRGRPNLAADLFGDWREELVLPGPDGKSLQVHTTTIPTEHRMHCLMQDSKYRLAVAWQNVVYNKPPHTSFYLGTGSDPEE